MSRYQRHRPIVFAALLGAALVLSSPLARASSPVSWLHLEPNAPVDSALSDWKVIACGDLGRFYVTADASTELGSRTQLVAYPRTQTEGGETNPVSLLDQPFDRWVAAIDWRDQHGQAVVETIRQFSESTVNVVLYEVWPPEPEDDLGLNEVTDYDVLRQLCRIEHDLTTGQLGTPPLVVNMSLGRLATVADTSCEVEGGAPTLGCAVRRVIDSLSEEHGVTFVAAAGNFGDIASFPAVLERVISTGASDSTALAVDGQVMPSWESPSGSQSLFAGSGVCLQALGEMAPAGSSTAAAVFSGTLAGIIAAEPLPTPYQGSWSAQPVQGSCAIGECQYSVRWQYEQLQEFPPAASLHSLMATLSQPASSSCVSSSVPTRPDATIVMEPASDPRTLYPSLLEVIDGFSIPAPTPVVCGACLGVTGPGNNGSGGTGVGGTGGGTGGGQGDETDGSAAGGTGLGVDLTGGLPLPDGLTLEKVFVRIGGSFFASPSTTLASEALDDLAAGDLESVLWLLPRRVSGSASMILILRQSEGELFWTSMPLLQVRSR